MSIGNTISQFLGIEKDNTNDKQMTLLRGETNSVGMDEKDYVQIGFQSISVIGGVMTWKENEGVDIATYETIGGKPIEIVVDERINTMNIGLRFLSVLGKNPTDILSNFKYMKTSGEPVSIIQFNGTNRGKWVIVDITSEVISTLPDGTVTELLVDLSLREYVDRKIIETTTIEKKNEKQTLREKEKIQTKTSPVKVVNEEQKNTEQVKLKQEAISGVYGKSSDTPYSMIQALFIRPWQNI